MNRVLLFGVLIMSALLFFGWQQRAISSLESEIELKKANYAALRVEKNTLAVSLEDAEKEKKRLADEVRQLDIVLAEREAKLLSSKQELAGLSATIQGLRKTDENFKIWADARVPDAVVRLLRDTRKGDSKN